VLKLFNYYFSHVKCVGLRLQPEWFAISQNIFETLNLYLIFYTQFVVVFIVFFIEHLVFLTPVFRKVSLSN